MVKLFMLLLLLFSHFANTETTAIKWQKLDATGQPVDIKLGPWSCATDNDTGLTWEVKSWHENQHYYKATYSYYEPLSQLGVKQGGSCQQGQEWYPCDVSEYITKLNQINYCGRSNWRLPTQTELQTLHYFKNTQGKLLINPYIFPRTTRNIYMTGDIDKREQITMVDFWHGKITKRPLNVVANVRLVSKNLP